MDNTLKIVSFNLQCFSNFPNKRVELAAAHIAKMNPDVIALQEVCTDDDFSMGKFFIGELKRNGYVVITEQSKFTHVAWGKYEEDILIIARHKSDRFKEGNLPTSPFQRSYVAIHLGDVWFVNTHLSHMEDKFRKEQVDFLVEEFKGEEVIFMGDFNSNPGDSENDTFYKNNFTPYFPGPTFPADKPEHSYDGFWISWGLRKQFDTITPSRIFRKSENGLYLSDHLGVVLDLEVR